MTAGIILTLMACGCVDEPRTMPDTAQCTIVERSISLPEDVRETSGIALSSFDPGMLWTHNDRNNSPHLFAIDTEARIAARVEVTGARNVDWEDMERAQCGGRACLYIGDIGDNDAVRESITIYEVPEPGPGQTATDPARALHARYPDGPRDAESLIVAPSGDIYIISKGRQEPVGLYRLSAEARQRGGTAVLEKVRDLAPRPADERDRVSAATLSPDGAWVAMRTYRTLFFFPAEEFLAGEDVAPLRFDLSPLGEEQGEAVALAADGTVWLTSEAESGGRLPTRSRLHCTLTR